MVDILPDSRARVTRGVYFDAFWGCNMIPVFCANCGNPHGAIPEKTTNFAFCLCDRCEAYGGIAHFYKLPEEAFFAKLSDEREAEQRRNPVFAAEFATDPGLADLRWMTEQLGNPNSTLSKLAEDWRRTIAPK